MVLFSYVQLWEPQAHVWKRACGNSLTCLYQFCVAVFHPALGSSDTDFGHMKMSVITSVCFWEHSWLHNWLFTLPTIVNSFLSFHLRLYSLLWQIVWIHRDCIGELSVTYKVISTLQFRQLSAATRPIGSLAEVWAEDVIYLPPGRWMETEAGLSFTTWADQMSLLLAHREPNWSPCLVGHLSTSPASSSTARCYRMLSRIS